LSSATWGLAAKFWAIIEEASAQVKAVLTDYLVETREEVLAGPFGVEAGRF
jgi:hypothetical protein